MKKSYFLLFTVYCLLSAVFLLGCGGGGIPGMPGSQGDTGVILEATITPAYNGKNTASVDVVPQICTPAAGTTPAKYEYYADHGATLNLNVSLLNPNTKVPPGILYIEKYTIDFRRSTDSIGAPPIEIDTRYTTLAITPPTGTAVATASMTVVLMDLKRKAQYYTDVTSGQYTTNVLNNYTATYTFEGQNQYGTRFSFVLTTNFQIGSFDNCV